MSMPFVGLDVLYCPEPGSSNPSQPFAGVIAKVHERKDGEPQRVNLGVIDSGGHHRAVQNVTLLDVGAERPTSGPGYATYPVHSPIESATGQSAADFIDGKPPAEPGQSTGS